MAVKGKDGRQKSNRGYRGNKGGKYAYSTSINPKTGSVEVEGDTLEGGDAGKAPLA